MKLVQTLEKPMSGYWDSGAKRTFEWKIDPCFVPNWAKVGLYVRVGSWEANHYFTVKRGKTERLTLSYAKQHIQAITKVPSVIEYQPN